MLMVRSFSGLRAVDLGFAPQGVVVARVALPAAAYQTPMSQCVFFDRLIERVRGLPGVRSAGLISLALLNAAAVRASALRKSVRGGHPGKARPHPRE